MPNTRWNIADKAPESFFEQFPELHPALVQILWNRGIGDQNEADLFLSPDWGRDILDPFSFLKMKDCVKQIFSSLSNNEAVVVHGDYDADGVCGSAVMICTLRDICRAFNFDEKKISSYIPHREREGYGLSIETVEILARERNVKLIITVDCGISNKTAIDRAHELGISVIVCDHHAMPQELPKSAIVIHPLVPGENYSNKYLCGAGVAFKTACAIYEFARTKGVDIPVGHEKWLLDLVAIATVTDMVPILNENRTLEKFGLLVLNKTKRPGLRALIELTGGKMGLLDTVSIGFQIGPRLNAAGRMSHADEALNLLIEENENMAIGLATNLHETNKDRQKRSEEMYQEAKKKMDPEKSKRCLIVHNENWPAGLVGLVAGKLVSEFHVPVMVFGKEGNRYVGSGRSYSKVDIMPALHKASQYLEKYGGHPQACGLSIVGEENFQSAIACIREVIEQTITDEDLIPSISIDSVISLEDISWDMFESIETCKPFGQGNPPPIFAVKKVFVVGMDVVGSVGKHLRLTVQSESGKILKLIGFGFGHRLEQLCLGKEIDIAFEISLNEWNNNRELQGKLVDLKTF